MKKILKIQNRKKEELVWKLLRAKIIEDLSEQKIVKVKVTIKNKAEIEKFSKN